MLKLLKRYTTTTTTTATHEIFLSVETVSTLFYAQETTTLRL